jgi:endo-1,4-beta-xylanase
MKVRLVISLSVLFTACTTLFNIASSQTNAPNLYSSNAGYLKSVVPFPVGAAVNINLLRKNPLYRTTVIKQFNSITAENAMKFGKLHPADGVFRWGDADELVDFAYNNNLRIHGHTLIWSANNPKWINDYQGTRQDWKQLLKTHIQTIVKHFKGKVLSWDVVNEAFNDNGTYKNSVWLKNIGPEYIALAFQYAHEADPAALLFYNDYGHEYGGRKVESILKMVNEFKRNKVPIHGLGLQMHIVVRMSNGAVAKSIQVASNTGLLVHISELEISVRYKMPKSFLLSDSLAQEQADKYKAIFLAFRKIPKRQQFGITTWNVGDKDAFRNSAGKNYDHPMMFDVNYEPKQAFKSVINAMSGVGR